MEDSKNESRGSVTDHLKDYLKTNVDLMKMKAADAGSSAVSNTASYAIMAITGLFFLIFASISLGFLLGRLLDNQALAFFIISVMYVIIGAVAWVNREKWFKLPALNAMLKKFM